jgi:hypothetical protein
MNNDIVSLYEKQIAKKLLYVCNKDSKNNIHNSKKRIGSKTLSFKWMK